MQDVHPKVIGKTGILLNQSRNPKHNWLVGHKKIFKKILSDKRV